MGQWAHIVAVIIHFFVVGELAILYWIYRRIKVHGNHEWLIMRRNADISLQFSVIITIQIWFQLEMYLAYGDIQLIRTLEFVRLNGTQWHLHMLHLLWIFQNNHLNDELHTNRVIRVVCVVYTFLWLMTLLYGHWTMRVHQPAATMTLIRLKLISGNNQKPIWIFYAAVEHCIIVILGVDCHIYIYVLVRWPMCVRTLCELAAKPRVILFRFREIM